jgi:hypothetical protein
MSYIEENELVPTTDLLYGNKREEILTFTEELRSLLERNRDLIDQSAISTILNRELNTKYGQYIQDRHNGRANDKSSLQPGISMHILDNARVHVLRQCEVSWPTPLSPSEFSPSLGGKAWKLVLPEGIFYTGFGGIQVYKNADPLWPESTIQNTNPLAFGYGNVVRIVGTSNVMWQNVRYNWDGTPKI